MANNSFDRTTLGLRERPVSDDFNRQASALDRSLRDVLQSMLSARPLGSAAGVPYTGFIGDGFRVVPTSPIGLSVQLTPGYGFFYATSDLPINLGATDLSGVNDLSSYKPLMLTAPQTFAVPTAPGIGQSRIDIIEVRYDRRLEDAQTRRQLDAGSKAFGDHVFFKTLAFALDGRTSLVNNPSQSTGAIGYKIGTAAATGSEIEPTVSTNYVRLARINVGPSVTTINDDVLVDRRPLLSPGGILPFAGHWRVQWNSGSPIITAIAIKAPPGVHVTLASLGLRGAGTLYVAGGQIVAAAATMTASHLHGHDSTDRFSIGLQASNGFTGSQVAQVDSSIQGQMATATPVVSVGIGTTVAIERIISRFVTNTGASNNTDTSLEEAIVSVTGSLSYV